MPRALTALLTAAVLVAGCGAEDSPTTEDGRDADTEPLAECDGTVEGVTVAGDPGVQPTVTFATPLSVEGTQCQVLIEGEGDGAVAGDIVLLDFMFVNGRTGEAVGSTWELPDPTSITLDDQALRGVRTALLGAKDGSRVIAVMSPQDAAAGLSGDETTGVQAEDTVVFVADVDQVNPRAEGAAVAPVAGLPTVELEPDGEPIISVPGGEPPAELVSQVLIEGTGPAVQPGQRVTFHFKGVLWSSGQEFDSTWVDGPTRLTMGSDGLAAFDKGLVGVPLGSQVLLVVPPADGYGEEGAPDVGIGPNETVVFVVDLLQTR